MLIKVEALPPAYAAVLASFTSPVPGKEYNALLCSSSENAIDVGIGVIGAVGIRA